MTNIDQFRVPECGTIQEESPEGWIMTLTIVGAIFGVFAIGLIVLLIYKSTLTMHRDDQLFLDDASSHIAGQSERAYHPGSRVQHWVRGISDNARGDVVLREAERGTVARSCGLAPSVVIRSDASDCQRLP